MSSTYATYTPASGSSRTKWTFSAWIKLSSTSGSSTLFGSFTANYAFIGFRSGTLSFQETYSGSETIKYRTNRVFRDTNSWYHIVVSYNTTSGVSQSDKIKMYVNGVRETSFGFTTMPSTTDYTSYMLNTYTHALGANSHTSGGSNHFDGSMSHVHLCDGYEYSASDFGSTDSVTGEWNINTSPSVSYGTNGFFVLKDGNSVTDQSGNSKNLSVAGGTLSKTLDNPSNNFATINNLLGTDSIGSTVNFYNGNTRVDDPSGSASGTNPTFLSTLGMAAKGKWYCELKPNSFSTSSGHAIGIWRTESGNTRQLSNDSNNKIRFIYADTSIYILKFGSNIESGLTAISSGDIVGMALDLDNGTLQYYVNGSARGSQITSVNSANDGKTYFFMADLESSSSGRYGRYYWNFGNGYFATTAVSTNSGNGYQDSNGQGKFEYQPPTNFLALCTKNLNL